MRKFGQFGVHGSPTLLYGIADDLLRRLQSVQNAAARLVAGSRRSDHITPVLRRLHWLPVRRRIEFKLALLIHKSLNGSTPRYLSDDCQLVSDVGRRRLRSSDASTCLVPRTHTGFGDRAFQVTGPRLWNSLPASLRQSDTTVGQFKKLLKTHLFSWDCGALVTVAFTTPCINISTTTTTSTPNQAINTHAAWLGDDDEVNWSNNGVRRPIQVALLCSL